MNHTSNLHPLLYCMTAWMLLFSATACQQQDQPAPAKSDSTTVVAPTSTEWLKALYAATLDPNLFNTDSITIVHYKQLTDSVSYCIFRLNDELCTSHFLATQVNRRNYQIRQLSESCDGDFANPVYTYSAFRFDAPTHTAITTEYVESARPEYVVEENGEKRFREGFTLENAKTTIDSMTITRKVQPDGKITERSK